MESPSLVTGENTVFWTEADVGNLWWYSFAYIYFISKGHFAAIKGEKRRYENFEKRGDVKWSLKRVREWMKWYMYFDFMVALMVHLKLTVMNLAWHTYQWYLPSSYVHHTDALVVQVLELPCEYNKTKGESAWPEVVCKELKLIGHGI